MTNVNVEPINTNTTRWLGSIEANQAVTYVDDLLMLTLGGVPWQVYFQVNKIFNLNFF